MWEPDSKEPSGHHNGPTAPSQTARSHQATIRARPHQARQQGAIRPPWGAQPHQAIRSLNSGACSNHWGQPSMWARVCWYACVKVAYILNMVAEILRISTEKKKEWHTLLNFNEEAMLFDRLTTAYLKEASIPVTTKSLSPLLVKPIREWTTSPATNSAEKEKKRIHCLSNSHKSGLKKKWSKGKKNDDEDGIRTHACRAQ